jgi:Glycosyl transferase family 2
MSDNSSLLYVSSAVDFTETAKGLAIDLKSNIDARSDHNVFDYGFAQQKTAPNSFPKRPHVDLVFADLGDARAKMLLLDHLGVSRSFSITIKSMPDHRILPVGRSGTSLRDSHLGWKKSPLGGTSATIKVTFQWPTRISRVIRGLGFSSFESKHRLLSLEVLVEDPDSAGWCTSLPSVWTPLSLAAEHDHRDFALAGSFAVGSSSVEAAPDESRGLTDSFQRRLIVGNGVSGLDRAVTWDDLDAGLVDAVFSDNRVFDFVPPVDVVAFNPRGFSAQPRHGAALTAAGVLNGMPVVRFLDEAQKTIHVFEPGRGVRESLVHDLRQFSYVGMVPREFSGPREFLTVLSRLLVAGVPVWVVGGVPEFAAGYLGAPLFQMLEAFDPFAQDDVLRREEWSVAARRLARERLSVDAYWERQLLRGPAMDGYISNQPSVSAIMCTMRAEFVGFALEQVERQTYPNLELVLVLHGLSREDPAIARAVANYSRPITVVEVPPTVVFGGALNRGVAASTGEYISKIDDDDWYGEHHIADLIATRSYAPADLIGGPAQLVYMSSLNITLNRIQTTETYGGHVAGASSLMSRDVFHSTGGWRQVNTHEDAMMIDSMNRSGGRVYRMHGMGFIRLRRSGGHTSIGGHDRFWSTHDASAFETYSGFRIPAAMTVESKYLPNAERSREWLLAGAQKPAGLNQQRTNLDKRQ